MWLKFNQELLWKTCIEWCFFGLRFFLENAMFITFYEGKIYWCNNISCTGGFFILKTVRSDEWQLLTTNWCLVAFAWVWLVNTNVINQTVPQWKKSNILVTKAFYCAPDDLDLSNWKWLNHWTTTIEIALCGLIEAEGDRNSFQSIWMDVLCYCLGTFLFSTSFWLLQAVWFLFGLASDKLSIISWQIKIY